MFCTSGGHVTATTSHTSEAIIDAIVTQVSCCTIQYTYH